MSQYVSVHPWIAPRQKVPLALIVIEYPLINSEGDRVICRTWTTGISAKAAMRRWLERNPDHQDATPTTMTETKPNLYDRKAPRGERVNVVDEYLAATG